jgi:hypothetical protein
MGKKADVKKLVEQKVVYDPTKNLLIVFRQPIFKAGLDRVFEIQNVQHRDDLIDFEASLKRDGLSIVSQSPPTNEWNSTSSAHIIWKVKAPNLSWKIPVRSYTTKGALAIRTAPICGICHTDDHATAVCPWKMLYPGIGEGS